jgi:glycosyltransferase involved in cell wall biosynthesis
MRSEDKIKLALIWSTFSFYHVARFKALHKRMSDMVLGIEIAGSENDLGLDSWVYPKREGLPIVTLFPERDLRLISEAEMASKIINKLESWGAGAVFVSGYAQLRYRLIIDWAQKKNKKCYIFSETKRNDSIRFFLKEWLKKRVIRNLDGAICGGWLHKEYLMELGMPEEKITFGYDVVDNEFFKQHSVLAKTDKDSYQQKLALPEKYFLSCSRFVKKKNLGRLISAYKIYRDTVANKVPWSLVIVGDGLEGESLKKQVLRDNIEGIIFAGSQNPEDLAVYYGLASCFILPSTTEQWGLVINEAMASSLPLLVSDKVGAADELVEHGVNGFKFDPYNVTEIAGYMIKVAQMDGTSLLSLGAASLAKISPYTPEFFAENIEKLILS